MRKIFTLALASVLATGAVQAANADEFTVIDDPASYITIGEISKPYGRGSSNEERTYVALDEGEEIVPVLSGYSESFGDFFHRLPLEVKRKLGSKDLDHVAVCFYDSNALTEQTDVETYCGVGADPATKLARNPFSASPLAITNLGNANPTLVKTAEGPSAEEGPSYPILANYTNEFNESTFELVQEFDGENVPEGEGDVFKGLLSFRLTDASSNSNGWKVRVLATYTETGQDDVILELESGRTYTVAYLGSLTDTRAPVGYGDIVQGGEKEVTGLSTTKYRANNTSDITLRATEFQDSGDSGSLTFGSNATPATSQVSLGCKPSDASEYDFFAGTSEAELTKTLLGNVDDVEAQNVATQFIEAATHDCKLFVGPDVALDTYDNQMTISIGASPES